MALNMATTPAVSTTTRTEPTDQDLMARLLRQDIAALEILYDRHHQIALGLACKLLADRSAAEYVVQEAFLTLWRQPERFNPAKGTPRGWLLAIVHHRSIDALRRGRLVTHSVDLLPHLIDDGQDDPCDLAASRCESTRLHRALDALPADQRRAIELSFLQGRTHVEIATLTDTPLGTVKGRIRIGLSKLRASLEAVPAVA